MEQLSAAKLDVEAILPMDLIRAHCKVDDTPGILDSQLELYRDAAFEAAEMYTQVRWFSRVKITQEIVSPRFRGLAQAAIARTTVELTYRPMNGIVNVYGTGDSASFWVGGIPLIPERGMSYYSIHLPPDATSFEMSNDLMFMTTSNSICDGSDRGGSIRQSGATVQYIAGTKSEKDVPAGVKLGCLKFIAWSIENPGDEFVPMVIRQIGVTTVTNNPIVSSGAIDEWRRYRKKIAR